MSISHDKKNSSWTKDPQFRQHFAATFRPLTQKMMVLVCRSTFLVHITMLAPKFPLLLNMLVQISMPFMSCIVISVNNIHLNFNALHVVHCHQALVLVQGPWDSGNERTLGHSHVCKNPFSTTLFMVFNVTHYLEITSTMDLIPFKLGRLDTTQHGHLFTYLANRKWH